MEEGKVMTTEHLWDHQIARLEALQAASTIGSKSGGPFGPRTPPDVPELVDLAEYIIHGTHPMDRYGDAANVHDA
jgi:hypothetical protein